MPEAARRFRFNVLNSTFVRKAVKNPLFPYVFQVAALGVGVWLIVVGFRAGRPGPRGSDLAAVIGKTNAATLIVWGLWWPGLVLLTLLLGRVWCTMCPLELVSNLARRYARQVMMFRGLSRPAWVRDGFIVFAWYWLLQFLAVSFGLHGSPLYTSRLLIALLGLAVVAGVLFNKPRAFCESICPAALLLNLYNRFTPIALTNVDPGVCRRCVTKDCVRDRNRTKWDARSCPSLLRPYDLKSKDPCVLCFQCAKVCPNGNIGFGAVNPAASPVTPAPPTPLPLAAALFVFMAAGFVPHDLFADVPFADQIFHAVPQWLTDQVRRPSWFRWFEAVWFAGILPGLVFGVVWLADLLFKTRHRLTEFAGRVALFLVPVLAAGHAMKALVKLNAWCLYLPGALSDPKGRATAEKITGNVLVPPPSLLPEPLAAGIASAALVLAVVYALRKVRADQDASFRRAAYVGIGVLGCLYAVVAASLLAK